MRNKSRYLSVLSVAAVLLLATACAPQANTQTTVAASSAQVAETTVIPSTVTVVESTTAQVAATEAVVQSSQVLETVIQSSQVVETAPVATQAAVSTAVAETKAEIGVDRAKAIALEKAGVAPEAASFVRAELDWEYDRLEYEIEFDSADMEYDVSVDAHTGEVLGYSSERRDFD